MLSELSRFSNLESGGILLGKLINNDYYIVEAIDAGINTVKTSYSVICDSKYLTHMHNTLSALYEPKLDVVGLWHKHNNNINPPFSSEDVISHNNIMKLFEINNTISILFQKQNEEFYVMKVYKYDYISEFKLLDFEIKDVSRLIGYIYTDYLGGCKNESES